MPTLGHSTSASSTESNISMPQGLFCHDCEPEYLIDDFEDVERLCVNCPKFEKCSCKYCTMPETEDTRRRKSIFQAVARFPTKLVNPSHQKHHHSRTVVFHKALEIRRHRELQGLPDRHITIVYNPVSGGGASKKLVDNMVVPTLTIAGIQCRVVPTEARGWCIKFMETLDPTKTDGVLVAGGDGLVHEAVTGIMRRKDVASFKEKVPMGIIPSGTANAMAHTLHLMKDKSLTSIIGHATLAAAGGFTRHVDVIKTAVGPEDNVKENIYALSVYGWGLGGTVAKAADQIRWIPGQKRIRYDLAGFVSFLKDWPVVCKMKLRWRGVDDTWSERDLSVTNLIATSLPKLGDDHPIHPEVSPDDGQLALTWVDSSRSRMDMAKMGMAMKKGSYLGLHKYAESHLVREFILQPDMSAKKKYDMLIDGDPMKQDRCHVTVLHKYLRVFAPLPEGIEDDEGAPRVRYSWV